MHARPQFEPDLSLPIKVKAFSSKATLESELATHISTVANQAINDRGNFRIVVTGGKTILPTYQYLRHIKTDWLSWSILWSDERCLPLEHSERNSRQAFVAWLSHVPIPKENIFVIPAELGPVAGSDYYSRLLASHQDWFDLVVLSLGEDGHVASIFKSDTTSQPGRDVIPVFDAPKLPAKRVSLSIERLAKTRELILLVVGKQKTKALENLRNAEIGPASQLTKQCCVTVWSSEAA